MASKQNLPRRYVLKPRKGKAFMSNGSIADHIYWRIFDTENRVDVCEFLDGRKADKELDRLNKESRATLAK